MRIAVDAMGGDHAPRAVVEGAAAASFEGVAELALVGDEPAITALLQRFRHNASRIRVVAATGAIPMDAKPRESLLAQPQASLPVAARLVAAGEADALVTAGNTGAVILACAQSFTRIPTVRRTALAAVIPTERRRGSKNDPFSLLLDAGATLRVGPEELAAFAMMGAAYASIVSKNPRPKVALLSNGSEPTKGTEEIVAAHALLSKVSAIEFLGNIEGVDLPTGRADVIVCDGFTGNITLKMLEGVSETVMRLARYAYRSKLSWRVAMWLLGSGIRRLKEVTDWQQYGGAPVLGFEQLCIKAHGRSGPRAIRNAVRVAERCLAAEVASKVRAWVDEVGANEGSTAER